jgi:hypothetical protein
MVPYTDDQLNRFIRWLRSDRSANFRGQTGQDFLDALGFTDALQDVAQLSSTMRVRLVCVVACIAQNIGGWNPDDDDVVSLDAGSSIESNGSGSEGGDDSSDKKDQSIGDQSDGPVRDGD